MRPDINWYGCDALVGVPVAFWRGAVGLAVGATCSVWILESASEVKNRCKCMLRRAIVVPWSQIHSTYIESYILQLFAIFPCYLSYILQVQSYLQQNCGFSPVYGPYHFFSMYTPNLSSYAIRVFNTIFIAVHTFLPSSRSQFKTITGWKVRFGRVDRHL